MRALWLGTVILFALVASVASAGEVKLLTTEQMSETVGGPNWKTCNWPTPCSSACLDSDLWPYMKMRLNPKPDAEACGSTLMPISCTDNMNVKCGRWAYYNFWDCTGFAANGDWVYTGPNSACDGTP